jgi:hypothetical protein
LEKRKVDIFIARDSAQKRRKRRRRKNLSLSLSPHEKAQRKNGTTQIIDTPIIVRWRVCFATVNAVDDDDDDDAHPKRGDDDDANDCDENETKSSKKKNRMQRLSETESGRAFERKLSAVEAPVGKVGDAIFGEE